MKTQRRHELQENTLAHWLELKVNEIAPYSKAIFGTVIAIVVLGALFAFNQQRTARTERAIWSSYFQAAMTGNHDKLKELADEFPQAPAGQWARLSYADFKFAQGMNDLFRNGADARTAFQDCQGAYERLRSTSRDSDILARASFGLGKVYEGLSDVAKAREEYQNVTKKWPGNRVSELASQRLADLDRSSTKEFYDWLAKVETRSPLGNAPGMPGERPSGMPLDDVHMKAFSGASSATVPAKPDQAKPAEGEKQVDAEKKEAPAKADEAKKEPAADSKPAAEPKANETKPAESKTDGGK